jgi:hypothetical protein
VRLSWPWDDPEPSLAELCLTREEREQLASWGYFIVRGKSGALYRIPAEQKGRIGICSSRNDPFLWSCIIPMYPHTVPDMDVQIARKLLVQNNESRVWQHAGVFNEAQLRMYAARVGGL